MYTHISKLFSSNGVFALRQVMKYSSKEIPTNSLENVITANLQSECGAIYDKKPFKMVLEAGKKYSWCACGKSKSQPLCDGTHKSVFLKIKLKYSVAYSRGEFFM